jgi:hypothetical protein
MEQLAEPPLGTVLPQVPSVCPMGTLHEPKQQSRPDWHASPG